MQYKFIGLRVKTSFNLNNVSVTFFDAFTGCTSIGTRAIASKSVESEELGSYFCNFYQHKNRNPYFK